MTPTALASSGTPTITTQLSTGTLVLNYPLSDPGAVTDTVTVTGEPSETGDNVYVHAYHATGNPPTPGTTSIATWEVPLDSNGTATTPLFIPESAGTFCFEATFKGTGKDTPIQTTACEVLTVTKFPASLTTAPVTPTSGSTLTDSADLTMYPPAPAEGGSGDYGSVDFTAYSDPACQDPVTGGAMTAAIGYSGTAFVATAVFNFTTPLPSGTYYWTASYGGNYDNLAFTSTCGEPTVVQAQGTLGANTPTITTQLSSSSISAGQTASDTATLTGASSNAGGTVVYTVYTNMTCTEGPIAAGTVNVTNGIVPPSNSVEFDTAGHYYWQAAYSGDSANSPAVSTCASEVLDVLGPSGTLAASTTSPVTGSGLANSGLEAGILVLLGALMLVLGRVALRGGAARRQR
ncbi:MAG: hypothetical protein ACRENY_06630 [Candidatus Dormibacteria bacterium]